MRNTKEIFQKLSRGQFISSNSVDPDIRAIYDDIEDNLPDYIDYFSQIDFRLVAGDGYYYFSRQEARQTVENKLLALYKWIDYVDFLKTYDTTFGPGTQFRLSQIESRVASDLELRDKLYNLDFDNESNHDKIKKIADEMTSIGYAEIINAEDEEYQVTMAFDYIQQILMSINIDEDIKDEIPE